MSDKKTMKESTRKKLSEGLKGNNNNLKWKTPEERIEICKQLCDHLRKGLGWECFPPASYKTIKSYVKNYPTEFQADLIEQAEREGYHMLYEAGIDGALKKRNLDAKTYQFIMMNKYKWGLNQNNTHSLNPEEHKQDALKAIDDFLNDDKGDSKK